MRDIYSKRIGVKDIAQLKLMIIRELPNFSEEINRFRDDDLFQIGDALFSKPRFEAPPNKEKKPYNASGKVVSSLLNPLKDDDWLKLKEIGQSLKKYEELNVCRLKTGISIKGSQLNIFTLTSIKEREDINMTIYLHGVRSEEDFYKLGLDFPLEFYRSFVILKKVSLEFTLKNIFTPERIRFLIQKNIEMENRRKVNAEKHKKILNSA